MLRGENMKILVIDDEPGWLALSRVNLQRAGHKVLTVRDWLQALRMTWYFQPDVIVLDVCMPKGGRWLLKTLKQHWPEVPVILHSVYSKYKEDPAFVTADGFAVKSVDCSDLMGTFKNILHFSEENPRGSGQTLPRMTRRSLRRIIRQLAATSNTG